MGWAVNTNVHKQRRSVFTCGVHGQTNPWIDRKDFISTGFSILSFPSVKEPFRKPGMPPRQEIHTVTWYLQFTLLWIWTAVGKYTISVHYLPPNVTSLTQNTDQGLTPNMKCYYRRGFFRKLVNHEGTVNVYLFIFLLLFYLKPTHALFLKHTHVHI